VALHAAIVLSSISDPVHQGKRAGWTSRAEDVDGFSA
jgi:hypothetical protein